jgi:uncharacterized protein (TIGR02594 family)
MNITAFQLAERFIGVDEWVGAQTNPMILAMLKLDVSWPTDDSVPWCSALPNFVCWLLRLPRSKSLLARSWLGVGQSVKLEQAKVGFDVVILNRGGPTDPTKPGPGHVGFYAGTEGKHVLILGGNQGDTVNVTRFLAKNILGIRRLLQE